MKDGLSNSVVQPKEFPTEHDLQKVKRFVLHYQQDIKWNFITTFNTWASRQER